MAEEPKPVALSESGQDHVVIRLRHANPQDEYNSEYESARQRFWSPYLSRIRIKNPSRSVSVDDLEARIRARFASSLQGYFEGIASRGIDTKGNQRKAAAAASLVVRGRIVGYSSLDLGVSFEPLEKAAEFFDHNFEYFRIALEAYAPEAFEDALRDGGIHDDDWDLDGGRLVAEVIPSAVVRASFGGTKSASHLGLTARQKAKWLWIVSNTSLLVPTALAAWFLYVSAHHTHEREKDVDKAYQELIKVQLTQMQSILAQSEKQNHPNPPGLPAPPMIISGCGAVTIP